jgi:tocopherol cyclase
MKRPVSAALAAYRRAGADPPFGDPARFHGAAMEGYYWRIVDAAAGRVLVWLCGVCTTGAERWAAMALAAHPGGFVRSAVVAPATGDPVGFGARAGEDCRGSLTELSVRLDDDAWVEAQLAPRVTWPRRAFGALGPAHAVPGLGQYWHPVLLAADVTGEACIGGERIALNGATAYAEKNWGGGFADRWWWGQADAFPGVDLTVAFAGGRLPVLGLPLAPTAAVVRLDRRVLRFAPPLARASASSSTSSWGVRIRSARHELELEGEPAGTPPHVLPVPDVEARRTHQRSAQILAGRLRVRLRRGASVVVDAVSPLAGLEHGVPAGLPLGD